MRIADFGGLYIARPFKAWLKKQVIIGASAINELVLLMALAQCHLVKKLSADRQEISVKKQFNKMLVPLGTKQTFNRNVCHSIPTA